MHHENVVHTIDFVMIGDKWYEVMEYCSGGDLFAAIQRGKMGQEEIDCCFKQMVQGVKYLHEMGVSHRDLKPENLLIDAGGHVKITDFGGCRKCFAILSGTGWDPEFKREVRFRQCERRSESSVTRYTVSKCSITKRIFRS